MLASRPWIKNACMNKGNGILVLIMLAHIRLDSDSEMHFIAPSKTIEGKFTLQQQECLSH